MNNYESIFVLKPSLEEEARAQMIERFQSVITKSGGELVKTEEWGLRKLAYEIQKLREGYYVLMQFKASPELPKELERNYKIVDEVIRYIVVNLDDK